MLINDQHLSACDGAHAENSESKNVRYISLFSGIGGLEHSSAAPLLLCEVDEACQGLLKSRYPEVPVHQDVTTLEKVPKADYVVGGWPCQDLSSAGKLAGLRGRRSGLFFDMLRVGALSGAHTLIGENVPNLLSINKGHDFELVRSALDQAGYPHISWRILNAREFGLPQERRRLFIVASKTAERALALHATPVSGSIDPEMSEAAYGFYWTGGSRSICFSAGYTPPLKIGATDNNGRAPVAVMSGGMVRKLTPCEFLSLQGFRSDDFEHLAPSTVLRMAGNAVALPVGQFVIDSVVACAPSGGLRSGYGSVGESGYFDGRMLWSVSNEAMPLAQNLHKFLDPSATESLSSQAAAGLIVRSVRSGKAMPAELFDVLLSLSKTRGPLRPSRSDSYAALDSMGEAVQAYRGKLDAIASV